MLLYIGNKYILGKYVNGVVLSYLFQCKYEKKYFCKCSCPYKLYSIISEIPEDYVIYIQIIMVLLFVTA